MKKLLFEKEAFLLFFFIVSVNSQSCNHDGVLDTGEECDDGNRIDNDGCEDCILSLSLDLLSSNNITTNYSKEFFDLDEVVYFVEPSELRFTLSLTQNWTTIFLVMLGDNPSIDDDIDIYTAQAAVDGRLDRDYSGFFIRGRLVPGDPRLGGLGINTSLVTQGMLIRGNTDSFIFNGDGDDKLSEREIEIALISAGYTAREEPGYNQREFCIIGVDASSSDFACVSLFFIGRNDDAPNITYTSEGIVSFTEGQMDFVPIINGTVSITDQDHPRYLQMSAEARIVGFTPGYPEFIGMTTHYLNFTYSYDETAGVFTISGPGTPEQYEILLRDLTYFNNMTEPIGTSRQIEITVFDGIFRSLPATVEITIVNVNDAPAISLDGEDPVITIRSVNYTEGNGSVEIVPNIVILDSDPSPIIQRVSVRITNPVDGDQERLSLSAQNTMGLVVSSPSNHEISFTGLYPPSVYTAIIRRVTYQHLDAAPGNPSTNEVRIIEFSVEDEAGATNIQNSTLQLSIIPVNDAPILFFTTLQNISDLFSGDSDLLSSVNSQRELSATFQYTEDDTPLNFGRSIYLRDVDSNIESATIQLTNLLNREEDSIFVADNILSMYGVNMTTVEGAPGMSRVITLTGEASPQAYEEILNSLTYRNLHSTNQVEDGPRFFTLTVNDTERLSSSEITATLNIGDRNDPPLIDLGAGGGADHMITFTEEGTSVPIATPHVVSIMDEEGHNISRLRVELVSPNGILDPSDAIFLRSPVALQFKDDFRTEPTTRVIDITINATTAVYTEALLSIFYDNAEKEPTLFNETNSPLLREVLVTIFDNNFLSEGQVSDPESNFDDNLGVSQTTVHVGITISPINDNAPRILIRAEPDGCGIGSAEDEMPTLARRRRDVKAASSRIRKRSIINHRDDRSKAPIVTSVVANFNQQCLDTITISFNTPTNIPIVEVSKKLNDILWFDVQQLNSAHKFGVWLDYSTLVVVFMGCPIHEDVGSNGRKRPMYVIFETERGGCDWTSICKNNTICFQNQTGCPIVGSYLITIAGSDCQRQFNSSHLPGDGERHSSEILKFVSLAIVIVVVVVGVSSLCPKRPPTPTAKPESIVHPMPEKVTPTVEEIHSQDFIITIPGGDGETTNFNLMEAKLKETQTNGRRKGKRKTKKNQREKDENFDEQSLLEDEVSLSTDEHVGVVTLSPERSHDKSCDQTHDSVQSLDITSRQHQAPPSPTREQLNYPSIIEGTAGNRQNSAPQTKLGGHELDIEL